MDFVNLTPHAINLYAIKEVKMDEEKRARQAFFSAGRTYDGLGNPSPYWKAVVTYAWNPYKNTYHVYAKQELGKGSVLNEDACASIEFNEPSIEGVHDYLAIFKELERQFRKAFGK